MEQEYYYRPLVFNNLAIHGSSAWFCNRTYSALFYCDLNSLQIELEAFFPDALKNELMQYVGIAYFDNKLIMAPCKAHDVLIYDLASRNFEKIELDPQKITHGAVGSFGSIYVNNHVAFLFPGVYRAIVKIDLNIGHVDYLDGWYHELVNDLHKEKELFFFKNFIKDGRICILPCRQNNRVLEFDIFTDTYKFLDLECDGKGFSDVCCSEGVYWFSCRGDGFIVKYSETKGTQLINIMIDGMEMEGGIDYLLMGSRYIYGIPFYGNMIVRLDKESDEVECFYKFNRMDFSESMANQGLPKSNIACCQMINDREAVLLSLLDGKILKIDLEQGQVTEKDLILSKRSEPIIRRHLKRLHWQNTEILYEQEKEDLEDFLTVYKELYTDRSQRQKNDLANKGE